MWKYPTYVVLVAALLSLTAVRSLAQEAKLLAVLQSDAAVEEKSAACRELARVATKASVPVLASLLGDEKLSHMARYALEPIRDPAADEALRSALAKVQGRPRLGVIGSLGARRDAKAVEALGELLKDADAETVRAAARALGNIGTPAAAKTLESALVAAANGKQPALYEGLLRAAEALQTVGQGPQAQAIYDRLRALTQAPSQVRAAALRGAILVRGKEGVTLIVEAIRASDRALAAVAIRTAIELPSRETADALLTELPKAAAERQGLLILALADRGDARVLPVALQAAQGDDAQLRVIALRALKRVGNATCAPALIELAAEGGSDVSRAAIEVIEILQDKAVDAEIVQRLPKAQGKTRLTLIELAKRRHTAAAVPALWLAAADADAEVRAAALAALGAAMDTADLPKLLARLTAAKDAKEAAALSEALRNVCLRSPDREAVAAQLAAALPTLSGPLKVNILDVLKAIGGTKSLETVAAAAKSDDAELRGAAFRTLGQWLSADAAPVLLDLYNTVNDDRLKAGAIRGYIRIARQFDMPPDRREAMCRTALEKAQRDEDKRLVLEVLLRYPSKEMRAIAAAAAKIPALQDEASLVMTGMDQGKGVDRAELGKILAQAGHKPVKLEILKAEFGAAGKIKDVTEILRRHAKSFRVIFLPSTSYNESLGGDPAPGAVKQLKIKYRIDGKDGEVSLNENAMIVLPMPK